jgi:hypothetical protein
MPYSDGTAKIGEFSGSAKGSERYPEIKVRTKYFEVGDWVKVGELNSGFMVTRVVPSSKKVVLYRGFGSDDLTTLPNGEYPVYLDVR